jgi:hypothetical protein
MEFVKLAAECTEDCCTMRASWGCIRYEPDSWHAPPANTPWRCDAGQQENNSYVDVHHTHWWQWDTTMSKERAQQCSMLVGILHSTDRSKSSTTLMSRFGTLVSTELNANKGYVLWSQERFTGALHSFYDGPSPCDRGSWVRDSEIELCWRA